MKKKIISFDVNITELNSATNFIIKKLIRKKSGYVCVANVHMVMEAFDNISLRKIVNDADFTVPDGRPLVWVQRFLGYKNAGHVRGSDLMLNLCKESEKRDIPIGLYGGSEEALSGFNFFLKKKFENINIGYSFSPPFRVLTKEEDKKIIESINKSGIKILFVGIGCPKQEKWVAEHKGKINCIMIGIGAAFDFYGMTKKEAPVIMQKTGTEWLFRFISEPKRLWKRYLKHNPRFIFCIFNKALKKIYYHICSKINYNS